MKTTLFGKIFLILPIFLILSPFALAFGFGLWYLMERGWLLYWFMATLAILSIIKIFFRLFRNKKVDIFKDKPQVESSSTWGNQDEEVFKQMELYAKKIDKSLIVLDKTLPNRLLDLGIATTQEVATHYYPDKTNPALEVTLPHLLKISELVIKDIRKEVIEKVPFSHSVTINHFLKVPKMMDLFGDANASYRVGRMVLNPLGSIILEMKDHITAKLFNYSKEELLNWVVDYYILEVARYSIDLYGHNITLNEFESIDNRQDKRDEPSQKESPLKITVVGQVNSGKSSLINALFGKDKAIVDNTPTQGKTQYYNYSTDDRIDTILVDTQGYQSINEKDKSYHDIIAQIKSSDIILLLLTATNAAREADKALLDGVESYFETHPKLRMPVIIGVLNQIDKLSPQKQWSPPFDVIHPKSPKEQNIQKAIEVAQKELSLDSIIPINLHPKREYNIKEVLIPTILEHLNEAKKVQYIRSLREYQSKEFWIKLKEQAKATGRLIKR
ncbi:MAG: GTPase [Campylobacterota bacterium]|nr:GTPase [Campylobacterota bacterium]